MSIGISSCFHAEKNALPGFLESASAFFDEIVMISAPPSGTPHCEESLEICKKWGAKLVMSTVAEGFGVLRTQCIRESSCEWVAILDADERLPILRPVLSCTGHQKYPECHNPDLHVTVGHPFNQGKMLKSLLETVKEDAIVMPRYHWFDFTYNRPCQNFSDIKDFQCRVVRNAPHMAYRPERKMHEQIIDTRTGTEPSMYRQPNHDRELAIQHYHCWFRPMEPEQNAEDLRTYQALDAGLTAGMWLEHAAMK